MWQLIILVAKEKVEGGSSLEEIRFSGCGCAPLSPGEIIITPGSVNCFYSSRSRGSCPSGEDLDTGGENC